MEKLCHSDEIYALVLQIAAANLASTVLGEEPVMLCESCSSCNVICTFSYSTKLIWTLITYSLSKIRGIHILKPVKLNKFCRNRLT